jgi:membrane protein DedA with SNARE-associated domain
MLQQFLHDFGYFALFLGTFFEGETILVLAGFLAFRGYMDINLVVVVAFFGSYAGDQLWYFMGRKHGRKILARKPRWQAMGDRALEHIRKHPDLWVLSFRFVYGLRTVMPVAIGLSGYPPRRYLLLNGIGAAVWALALGLPPTTSARSSKACSAASRSTSYGCSAPCWAWACCWLRRASVPSAERRAAAEGQEAQAEQAVSQEQPPSQGRDQH